MRIYILVLCLLNAFDSFAQKNKFSLYLGLRPELTTYKKEHTVIFDEQGNSSYFNSGLQAAVQYNIMQHFFIETGIGFVNRKFHLTAFFDQSAIPPPRQSFTQELVHSRKVFYRTFELPIAIGYQFFTHKKLGFSLQTGYIFNYLWNGKYKTSVSGYDGTYAKRYWLGSSPIAAIGVEHKLKRNSRICGTFTYLFKNMDKKDSYLYGRGQNNLAITHSYLSLGIGIRKQF